jgi:hypothetical protein
MGGFGRYLFILENVAEGRRFNLFFDARPSP